MKYKKTSNRVSLLFTGLILFVLLSPANLNAQDNNSMNDEVLKGMALFQGEDQFINGGPSCITCHHVTNDNVMTGGRYAKDLTDVYERFGVGLSGWLQVPDPPAMAASYNYNPLEENERAYLSAFFKSVYETEDAQAVDTGYMYFLIGGSTGLFLLLVLVQLIWSKRKSKMVKVDIFSRQSKAWDAKF